MVTMRTLFLTLFLFLFGSLHAIVYFSSNQPVTGVVNTAAPSQLTFQGSNAAPQIAVSSNGQAIAIWLNFPSPFGIQGMFFDGSVWVPLVNIDGTNFLISGTTSPSNFATGSAPKVGIDQFGNSIVVWVSPFNQIQVAVFHRQFLQPSATIPTNNFTQLTVNGTFNASPSISVNQLTFAMVVWTGSNQVFASTFTPNVNIPSGGTWSAPFPFLPMPFGNQPNGVNPAGFGLGTNDPTGINTLGTAVWLDAPTGIIFAKSFIPFLPILP